MKGSRPAQASLTRNTDLSKTKETQRRYREHGGWFK